MRFACKDCDGKALMQLPCAALKKVTWGQHRCILQRPQCFDLYAVCFHFSACGVVCVLMIFMVSTFANGFGIQ